MKKNLIYGIIAFLTLSVIFTSCKKKDDAAEPNNSIIGIWLFSKTVSKATNLTKDSVIRDTTYYAQSNESIYIVFDGKYEIFQLDSDNNGKIDELDTTEYRTDGNLLIESYTYFNGTKDTTDFDTSNFSVSNDVLNVTSSYTYVNSNDDVIKEDHSSFANRKK